MKRHEVKNQRVIAKRTSHIVKYRMILEGKVKNMINV